jgi:osmotically-inducible protein OsmY
MDLTWGQGVASTDAWAGSVDGVVVAVDGRVITHLIVKRGLLFARRYVVPVTHAFRWDPEGVYLNVATMDLFGFPRADGPDGQESSASLTSRTRATSADGDTLHVKGVRHHAEGYGLTHLIVKSPGRTGRRFLLPVHLVADLSPTDAPLTISEHGLDGLPTHRADAEIQNDLWEALYGAEVIPPVDLSGMRLDVSEGLVRMEGNARSSAAISDAVRIVRSTNGVGGVENRLVSDWDIDLAIAACVSSVGRDLAGTIAAHTQLGTVRLEGWAPSVESKETVVRAVASVDGVLSVEDELEVRTAVPVTSEAPPEASAPEPREPPPEQETDTEPPEPPGR